MAYGFFAFFPIAAKDLQIMAKKCDRVVDGPEQDSSVIHIDILWASKYNIKYKMYDSDDLIY